MKEHFDDKYANEARKKGYRLCLFQNEEIQTKDKLLSPGMTVVGFRCGAWWRLVSICC
ncbi:hypothetical protein OK016_05575 [Vibrio chagasii]|nr:hypothetical protein [Vibrio chagasii]